MRRSWRFAVLLGLSILIVPAVHADEPPLVEIEVVHPISMGFSLGTDVSGGILRSWLTEGYPLVLKRDINNTLMWGIQIHTDDDHAYLNAYAPSMAQGGNTTCCKWTCDNGEFYHLDDILGDCYALGGGCQVCTLTCSGGWVNCPAGTKKVVTY